MSQSSPNAEARGGPLDLIVAGVQALRMKQWIKNLLLYAALIFALKFNELAMFLVATKALL